MSRTVEIRRTDTVIHVNRGIIDGNRKHRRDIPPLTVRKGKTGRSKTGDRIVIFDAEGRVAAEVVYNKDGILPCGAKAVVIAYYGAGPDSGDLSVKS